MRVDFHAGFPLEVYDPPLPKNMPLGPSEFLDAMSKLIATFLFLLGIATLGLALDGPTDKADNRPQWPQWRGPNRDSICTEKGLLTQWPAEGPKLLWQSKSIGLGYSTPVIANGRIYAMSWRGDQDGVWAANEADGNELWFTKIGEADKKIGYPDGSRCSPTVDGNRLYALTANGDLACLDDQDGRIIWQTSFKKNFGGKVMSMWGFSESPLIDGDKLIATPGGADNTIVAFDKNSGSVLWRAKIADGGGAGYSSPVSMTVAGRKMYLSMLGKCLVAVDADTGAELWRYSKVSGRVANIPTPIIIGDHIFCTTGYSAYNGGSALLKIVPDSGGLRAQEIWHLGANQFMNHHGGVVLVNGHFYGGHGQNDGQLTCVEMSSGKVKYRVRGPGKGSAAILYADGHLYYRYQDGTMALVKVNPNKEEVVSKFKLPNDSGKPSWPHPVICDGKLYIRDMDVLMCFDVKKK
jgi:outer membrane protein assembly factor BamB